MGEGKTYRTILGGGKCTIECALQNQFWRPQKVGFAWSVPVSSKENNRAKTNGGEKTYHRWGGPKPFLGMGFYGMFSPPLSFFTPLCLPLSFPGNNGLTSEERGILYKPLVQKGKTAINLSNLGNFCQIWPRAIYLC